jgi:hypothetical protein
MISAEEDDVRPARRTAEVRRILPAACRMRIEAFVEEVKGDPRRTRSRGMTEYLISASPSLPPLCGAATNRVGLEPVPSMTAEQEGN